MEHLRAFEHRLTSWLGLQDVIDLSNDPLHLEFDGGIVVTAVGQHERNQILLTTTVHLDQPIDFEHQLFLLELNNPSKNSSGIVLGADVMSGVVTVSRRFDPRALNQNTFENVVKALIEIVQAADHATAKNDLRLFTTMQKDVVLARVMQDVRPFDILIDGLEPTGFALEVLEDNFATISMTDALFVVEGVGAEIRVRATGRAPLADVVFADWVKEMLLRNLFLAKCSGGGFFLDSFGRPGSTTFFYPADDVEAAFGAAAAGSIGDLMHLLGYPINDEDFVKQATLDPLFIKV